MELTYRYSGIARAIDPRYRSNVLIMVFNVLVFLALGLKALVIDELDPLGAGVLAFNAAASVFIAWILARELDPDHLQPSAVAPLLALLPILALNWEAALIPLAALVMSQRVITRTTGVQPSLLDLIGLLGVVIWTALTPDWLIGLAVALALMADSWLHKPHPQAQTWAGVYAVATIITAVLADSWQFSRSIAPAFALLALGLVVWHRWVESFFPAQITCLCDRDPHRMNRNRIIAGQTYLIIAFSLVVISRGEGGAEALFPVLAAVVGFLAYHSGRKLGLIPQSA
jgi:hypothetical protein